MHAETGATAKLGDVLRSETQFFRKPAQLIRTYDRENLRPDLLAGLTVAAVLLPQAIAYALIAGLPPQVGLYTAAVAGIVGALFGSSNQLQIGPTNAISLLVLSTLLTVSSDADPVILAGLMAVMVGLVQFAIGVARLGMLVNFVSHSVTVGFTAGAGVIIAMKQVMHLLGLEYDSRNLIETVAGIYQNVAETHLPTLILGGTTILVIVALKRFAPKLPGSLIGMVLAAATVALFGLEQQGVSVISSIPSRLPPLSMPPILDIDVIGQLAAGALAVAAIGLVKDTAIARSISSQTGQRLDTGQEFVGQGLANIAAGFLSGYPSAGSFMRTNLNHRAGGRTPMASAFSGLFVLIAMLALGPLATYVPNAALAGLLMVIAYRMVDRSEIVRIWRGTRGDALIMLVTFLGTLFLEIQFAVLTGILISFAHYVMQTSAPTVTLVSPDSNFRHFTHQPGQAVCPQLAVIEILGDLYFGAVSHVEEAILEMAEENPEQRFLLMRMNRVNQCDFSGIHMLENVRRTYLDRGGDIYMIRVGDPVLRIMESTGFCGDALSERILTEDDAINFLFRRVLDPAVCIYECPVRVFKECQNLPKRETVRDIPLLQEIAEVQVAEITSPELWQTLHNGSESTLPIVVDVREPREFRQGHIPEAELVPLPYILEESVRLPRDRGIVLVCRTGRRSRRAAYALQNAGIDRVRILKGGMLAWKGSGLLEAME